MKKLYLVVIICMAAFNAMCQSQAGASASATIVSPVGAELSSEMSKGYFDINYKKESIKALVDIVPSHRTAYSSEYAITSAASIRLIGSVNVYDVSVQTDSITLRNTGNDTMEASFSLMRTSARQGLETFDETIVIDAKIHLKSHQLKGVYDPAAPYCVTINFN